jgi:Wiskott-Aldrich syndrome protein
MGFTENSHPNLSGKVMALLPIGDPISKDREDDIVTTLLEELIPISPKPSPAPGHRNEAIPGAWQ